MGLKFGIAVQAAKDRLYVPLGRKDGNIAFSFARIYFCETENSFELYVRYLNGVVGRLFFNNGFQLEVRSHQQVDWVPTKIEMEVMQGITSFHPSLVIFEGRHSVREIPESELLPPALHSNSDRFKNPKGLWNRVVAEALGVA